MDKNRLQAEKDVLREKLGINTFHFDNEVSPNWLYLAAKTNRGNLYTLKVKLDRFPESIPEVYVTKMLRTKDGEEMSECSAAMHTLRAENNCTRICHCGTEAWTNRVSLYRVFIRCRLWLEIYEQHLKTGENMDEYLKHQQ